MLVLLWGSALDCCGNGQTLDSRPPKKALLIVSYHLSHEWTREMVEGVKAASKELLPWNVAYNTLELDTLRTADKVGWQKTFERELSRLNEGRYDFLLILDDEALLLFFEYYDQLTVQLPVIFAGIETYSPEWKAKYPNVTGLTQTHNVDGNIRTGLALWPETKEILILTDSSTPGRALEEKLKNTLPIYPGVNLTYLHDQAGNLMKTLSILGQRKDTLLVVNPWRVLFGNDYQTMAALGTDLFTLMDKPYLVSDVTLYDYGALGGYITEPSQYAREWARMVGDVLEQGPQKVEVRQGELVPVFDWKVMKDFDLDLSALPEESILLNMPLSPWEIWGTEVIYVCIMVLFVVLLALAYGYQMRRMTKKNQAIYDALPARVGVCDEDEKILFLSATDVDESEQGKRYIKELDDIDYEKISPLISEVFKTGQRRTFEYRFGSTRRVMSVAPLDERAFGTKAVIWISHDNSETQKVREQVEELAQKNLETLKKLEDTNAMWDFVINSIPIHVYAKDVENDFRYILANKTLLNEFGLKREQLCSKTDYEIFPREDADAYRKSDTEACKAGQVMERECPVTYKDGRRVTFRVKVGVFTDSNGKKIVLGVGMDMSELITSRLQVENSNRLWDAVINELPVYFFAKEVDREFRYLLVNQRFSEEFVGRKSSDVIGRTDYELFETQEEADHFRNDDLRIVKSGKKEEFIERVAGGTGGGIRVLRTTKQVFTTADGRRLLLGTTIDVSRENNLIESEKIINKSLSDMVQESSFDKSLDLMAGTLQKQVHADRVGVWCRRDGSVQLYREWFSKGIIPLRAGSSLDQLSSAMHKLVGTHLSVNKIVFAEDQGDSAEAKVLRAYGTRSVIAAPIFVEGAFWGVVHASFINASRTFSEVDERIMRSMGNMIALAWVRTQQLETIQTSNYEKQMILNNIKVPIRLYDGEGNLLHVNTSLCKMMGKSEAELLTMSREEFLTISNLADRKSVCNEMLLSGTSRTMDLALNNRYYELHVEPVLNKEKKLINVVTSAIDVTELKQKVQQETTLNTCMRDLLNEEDLDRAINDVLKKTLDYLKPSRVYVMTYQSEGSFAQVAYEVLQPGRPSFKDWVKGLNLDKYRLWYQRLQNHRPIFLPNVASPESRALLKDTQEEISYHEVRSLYAIGLYLDGKLFASFSLSYEEETCALRDYELKFMQTLAHVLELAFERKRAHEKVMASLKEARDADKAKSYFLASMSHELRTPLNAVIGFSELLRDSQLDYETQQDYLNSIVFSGNALLQLINDVLDLSKLEAGQMALQLERCNFENFCKEIAQMFIFNAKAKGLELEGYFDKMPLLYVDELRMRQILFNLVGNAVKYSEKGKVVVRSHFDPINSTEGTLRVSVSDTGIGIKDEDQKKLFEPFVQLSRMRGTNASNVGTGLGLAVTRRLVERMGGKLSLKSILGKGSTFTVEIPKVEYKKELKGIRHHVETVQPVPEKRHLYSTVLLVDDVDMNLKVLEAAIQKFNVEVTLAHSGKQAVEILETRHFDLILTDLWMPEMSGEELAWATRLLPNCLGTKVMAVSADTDASGTFKMDIFDGVLSKPITTEQLEIVFEGKKRNESQGK